MIHVILHMYESVQIFAKIPKLKDFQDQIHRSTNDHHLFYHYNHDAIKLSKLLRFPLCRSPSSYFKQEMIKDQWFKIYAIIHAFSWKTCLLDHS